MNLSTIPAIDKQRKVKFLGIFYMGSFEMFNHKDDESDLPFFSIRSSALGIEKQSYSKIDKIAPVYCRRLR